MKKVHKLIKFDQNGWLKPYINMNTDLRKKAIMILKMIFLKLMNNVIFGKTIENVKKLRDIKWWQEKEERIINYQNQIFILQSFSQKSY